jgi:hypothetical protein
MLITDFRRIAITLMLKTMNQKTAPFFLKAGLSRIVFPTKFFFRNIHLILVHLFNNTNIIILIDPIKFF